MWYHIFNNYMHQCKKRGESATPEGAIAYDENINREYINQCVMHGWKPTCEGLSAYKRMLNTRRKWIN